MGQSSTKHGYGHLATEELLNHVCAAAEKLSAKLSGKHSVEILKRVAALRDQSQLWSSWQRESEQLQGRQVMTVAAALQALTAQLDWCTRKLHQRHLVSFRTLSSRQQAAHVLRVLSAAKEALGHFSAAFTLALMLSRDQNTILAGNRQQQLLQQHQRQQQQQQQQTLLVKEEEAEWQQLHLGREVVADDEGAQVQHAPRAPDSSTGPPGAAAEAEAECQAPHQPPPCEPALSLSEGWNASQAPHHPPLCEPALSLSEGWSASQAGAANCLTPGAVTAANTAHATELLASAAGPMGQQHDFSIAEAAAWEHSQDGWQQLVRRAWRGDVQAVLACAQELIHGGDFCLQDFDLARQLLQTVADQSCGTACLWLGQLSERGLGLPAADYVEAAAWYGQGAELGHLECAQALAFCYQHGLGLAQDTQAATEWYEFAAQGGLAAAQHSLGQLLLQARHCSRKDTARAMYWLQAAADQGGCHKLGLSGQGPDVAAAQACYEQAGIGKALLRLGRLYLPQRQGAAATAAFKAASAAGSAEALLLLAKLQSGSWAHSGEQQLLLLPLDVAASIGAGSSLGASARSIAGMRMSGGKRSSRSSSGAGFGTAAGSGAYSTCCSSLAAQASAEATQQLYNQAAEAGVAEAQHMVGCTQWSTGHVADAMQSWHTAAAQGFGPSLLCLAAVAEQGLHGVKRDAGAARACYAMAAACGCQEAAVQLARLDQDAALHSSMHIMQGAW